MRLANNGLPGAMQDDTKIARLLRATEQRRRRDVRNKRIGGRGEVNENS